MKNSTTDLTIIDFLTPFMDKQLEKEQESGFDYEQQVESPFLDEKISMESWIDDQKVQEMDFPIETLSDEQLSEFEEEDHEEEQGYDIEAVAWYDETGYESQMDEPHYNFAEMEELVDINDESEDEFYDYDESFLEPDTNKVLSDVKGGQLSPASLEPGGGLYGSDQYSTDMEEEQFIGSIWPFFSGFNIVDRTAYSPESKRKKVRNIDDVYALVLHQTGFSRGNTVDKYNKVTAHFVILPNGTILQLHPLTAYLWASNGFNKGSVAVEFVGNFPSDRGKCYKPEKFGCHKVTDKQVQTGRELIKYLIKEIGLTHVLAHRQSSGSRGNDPGPEIWSRVGQWGVDEHGLKDGGPGFKIKSGRAISESWRNKSQQELIPDFEKQNFEKQTENSFLEGELLSESLINEDEPESEITWEYLNDETQDEVSWSNELEKELLNEDMAIVKAAPPASSAKTITLLPKADHLYRIKKGDNLLKIAGTAYKKKAGSMRLERAQLINRHPFNWRYYTAAKKKFTRKYFPEGVISFSPYFSCFDTDFNFPSKFPKKGSCYSLIFIPPETDIWQRRPDEEIQPDLRTCWAAAILSWSKVVPGARKFKSVDDVVVTFRKYKLKILMENGVVVKRDIVTSSGALVRWPKKKVDFIESKGKSAVVVQAGQKTLEKVAAELGLNLVIKDSSLSISDVQEIFRKSNGPVIVLKFNKGIGHGTVIFGVSESDKMIGEMDPFPAKRPTGPAYGSMMTRWLPTFESFKKDSHGKPWSDFSFLF